MTNSEWNNLMSVTQALMLMGHYDVQNLHLEWARSDSKK